MKRSFLWIALVLLVTACGFDAYEPVNIQVSKPSANYFTTEFAETVFEDTVAADDSVTPGILTTAFTTAITNNDRDVVLTLTATQLHTMFENIVGTIDGMRANVSVVTTNVDGDSYEETRSYELLLEEENAPNSNTNTPANYNLIFVDLADASASDDTVSARAVIRYKQYVSNPTFGDVAKGAKYPLIDLLKVPATFTGRIDAVDIEEAHTISGYFKTLDENDIDEENALEFPKPYTFETENGIEVYMAVSDYNDADIYTTEPSNTNAYLSVVADDPADSDSIGYITIVGSDTVYEDFNKAYKIWVLNPVRP